MKKILSYINKLRKSKTINFNALAAAVLAVLRSVGVDIPPEVVESVLIIMNILLRMVTSEPISKK